MAGFSTQDTLYLTRTNLWSNQLKDVLLDELFAQRYVDWITDFPDGTTLNIPSIGQFVASDYAEGQAIQYSALDTGNFTFTIDKYKSVGTYIYDKFKHDSFYVSQLTASFVPKMQRALAKSMEVDFLKTMTPAGSGGQTTASTNAINGAAHRLVGSGTNETIAVKDFALANYALDKANVPRQGRIAILDPSCEYALATMTNLVNVSNNPQWEGIVRDGMSTGMRFRMSVFGWDVYISQNLHVNTASEQIGSVTAAAGVNNLFFSAASDVLPIKGLVRQAPRVEFERNKDLQRDEFVVTCYYGFKGFRPENMFILVTDTDQVS
jgi:hypothetical protein